jgi:hypothetical protein
MIRSFRTAIWTLGSGSLLITAAALLRDQLPRSESLADLDLGTARIEWKEPAEVADTHGIQDAGSSGPSLIQTLPAAADQANSGSSINAAAPDRNREKPSAVFQSASMQSAPRQSGRSIQFGPMMPSENAGKNAVSSAAKPVVVLKPEERPIARREKNSAAVSDTRPAELGSRIYHPSALSVSDLERLIRPLLTLGIGTATASTTTSDAGPADDSPGEGRQSPQSGSAERRPDVLLVHDRPEVLQQIDAIYADLEAAPKRVVIDALIADVALPNSVPPGWELRQSRFGVIDAEPRTVLNSLRVLGRVSALATNQLQVIDRQWAQLEWTERAGRSSAGGEPVGPAQDPFLRLSTTIRIRPSVLSSGLIRLEVHPTSSRLKEGPSVRPEIATVAFTTDIVLHSGATAVIAGSVDERPSDVEGVLSSAKGASHPGDAPSINPQPSVRHETVLLLMPRIAHEN